MPISGVADYTGYDPDYVPETAGDDLDNDDFLKLIIAQLANQNPLEPMESNEFMTQMAAMGTMEEMQNLNSNFQAMMVTNGLVYGSQLIGQTVQAIDQTTRSVIEGVVGEVSVSGDEVQLQVGSTTVALDDIISVSPWTESSGILEASRLIGMKITAWDPYDYLGFSKISGVVEEAGITNGAPCVTFTAIEDGNSYTVELNDIVSVSAAGEASGENGGSGTGGGV